LGNCLWQLFIVIDSVSVFEVAIAPGSSCHVRLAAPVDDVDIDDVDVNVKRGKRKKGERENERKTLV
jgi:hypothetical protein